MTVQRLGSGSPWEDVVGYSRVVRAGELVWVSGTTGTQDGVVVAGGAAAQTRQALSNVIAALERVGASAADVVRTRLYVTDIAQWEEQKDLVPLPTRELAGSLCTRPSALIDPAMVVEVEADAWLGASS